MMIVTLLSVPGTRIEAEGTDGGEELRGDQSSGVLGREE